ncbi:MAG: MFS transporter, partial [Candidatus Adiutrix sp.]
ALDIRDQLGLDADQMAMVFALTLVGYGFVQPLAGFSVDRYGPKRCLLISSFFMGVSAIWFSMADSMVTAALARVLTGVASGLSLMPGLRLIINWLPAKYFGVGASVVLGSSALANFTAGRPLAWLVENHGWRFAFVGIGGLCLVTVVLVWFLIKDKPDNCGETLTLPNQAVKGQSFFNIAFFILKNPGFWILGFVYLATDTLYLIFISLWAGPYLIEVQGQPLAQVGNILSVAAIGFMVGPTVLALWGDRWGSYPKVILCISIITTLFWGLLIWGPEPLPLWSLYVVCLLAPIGGWSAALYMSIVKDFVPAEISSSAMGFLNMAPILAGAVLQHLVGWLMQRAKDSDGSLSYYELYAQAFTPIFFITALSVVLAVVLIIRPPKPSA